MRLCHIIHTSPTQTPSPATNACGAPATTPALAITGGEVHGPQATPSSLADGRKTLDAILLSLVVTDEPGGSRHSSLEVLTNYMLAQEDIGDIFKKADKDNSGTLTVKEMQAVVDDILERYPQIELYLKSRQMKSIVDLMKDAKEDAKKESIELDIEEFKSALSEVDSQMKNLPATAQVAAQQGAYLADCFNRMEQCEKNPEGPIRIRGEGRHRFKPFR
ncbi:hypothetical protein Cgig2_024235 [Carnegiea gigantea]|uniref:NADH:ubiquinone reductase (non-electrogenic) n=1 Tax=Carnegiea gigantea TaxID=171969 RepID=A0A9Q1K0C9_9CARY|nr:hypothetical protein Cgig2_024235 [Carnegiea gigantea]